MTDERIYQGLMRPMRLLSLPFPPRLDAVLGYDRPDEQAARFVAFYRRWDEGEGVMELRWDDGRNTSTADETSWEVYTMHPTVQPPFHALLNSGVCLGEPEMVATHAFLIDRQIRRAYAGTTIEVMRLLALQHVPLSASSLTGPLPDRTKGAVAKCGVDLLRRLTLSQLLQVLGRRLNQAQLTVQQERQLPEVQELARRVANQQRLRSEMLAFLDAGGESQT